MSCSFSKKRYANSTKYKCVLFLKCTYVCRCDTITSPLVRCLVMRPFQTVFFVVAVAMLLFAQDTKSVADRLATQNPLFDEQYESDLRNFPERATAFGDYRSEEHTSEL